MSCLVDVPELRDERGAPGDSALACAPGVTDCDGSPASCETEILTNPLHCGACFHDCLGGACVGGKCRPLVLTSATTHPFQFALSSTDGTGDLYWSCDVTTNDLVWRATSDLSFVGRIASVAVAGTQDAAVGIALGPSAVFWAQSWAGGVYGVDRAGGESRCLTADVGPGTFDLATDGAHVYFSNVSSHHIGRVAVDAKQAEPDVLVETEGTPHFVALAGEAMYWSQTHPAPGRSRIMRAGKDGSGACEVISTDFEPWDVAVELPWIYWRDGTDGNPSEGRVMKARDGCPSPEVVVLADGQGDPRLLALDATHVYYTIELSGALRRVPKDGGPVEVVYDSGEDAHGIAVDDRAVYWSNWGGNKVYRLAR